MNLAEGLASLDPAFARDKRSIWMTAQLFNGLVSLDSLLKVRPALARSWEISEDGLQYRFHLRKGIKISTRAKFGERILPER